MDTLTRKLPTSLIISGYRNSMIGRAVSIAHRLSLRFGAKLAPCVPSTLLTLMILIVRVNRITVSSNTDISNVFLERYTACVRKITENNCRLTRSIRHDSSMVSFRRHLNIATATNRTLMSKIYTHTYILFYKKKKKIVK